MSAPTAPVSKQAEAAAVDVEEVKSILLAVGLPVEYFDALEQLGLTSVVLLMSETESGGALAQDPPAVLDSAECCRPCVLSQHNGRPTCMAERH